MGTKANIDSIYSFGLIGKSLKHSFSKSFFADKFSSLKLEYFTYQNFEIPNEKVLANFLLDEVYSLKGFNITIPYKEIIIPYLDEVKHEAKEIQSVNTVLVKGEKLIGYNTDYYGFTSSIKPLINKHHKRALVLGTGGASKSIVYALVSLGIDVTLVSRKPKKKDVIEYVDIDEKVMLSHQIIINCTPVGTFPEIDIYPDIPYQYLNQKHLVYDLVYNPKKTLFLNKSEKQGATIQNGLAMLQLQAEKSWEIWNS